MAKRILNLWISMLLSGWDWTVRQFSSLFGGRPSAECVVLAYHAVSAEQRHLFANQMDELTKRVNPLRADVSELPLQGGRFAAITFDDGLENILENALPELTKRNIPATLFIVTDVLGSNPSWEYFGGDDPTKERAMTEEQLRRIPSGLFTIGSHTMTHPVLPSLSESQMKQELEGSRIKLEKMLDREVKLLSFPYGAFDDSVVKACADAQYSRVFSALPIRAFSAAREFVTGRVGVNPTDWPIEFRLKLAGAYRWLPLAYAWKRRLRSSLSLHRNHSTVLQTGGTKAA